MTNSRDETSTQEELDLKQQENENADANVPHALRQSIEQSIEETKKGLEDRINIFATTFEIFKNALTENIKKIQPTSTNTNELNKLQTQLNQLEASASNLLKESKEQLSVIDEISDLDEKHKAIHQTTNNFIQVSANLEKALRSAVPEMDANITRLQKEKVKFEDVCSYVKEHRKLSDVRPFPEVEIASIDKLIDLAKSIETRPFSESIDKLIKSSNQANADEQKTRKLLIDFASRLNAYLELNRLYIEAHQAQGRNAIFEEQYLARLKEAEKAFSELKVALQNRQSNLLTRISLVSQVLPNTMNQDEILRSMSQLAKENPSSLPQMTNYDPDKVKLEAVDFEKQVRISRFEVLPDETSRGFLFRKSKTPTPIAVSTVEQRSGEAQKLTAYLDPKEIARVKDRQKLTELAIRLVDNFLSGLPDKHSPIYLSGFPKALQREMFLYGKIKDIQMPGAEKFDDNELAVAKVRIEQVATKYPGLGLGRTQILDDSSSQKEAPTATTDNTSTLTPR